MTDKDRQILQTLGDKMKDIDQDVWIKYTNKLINSYEWVIIDDLRFQNEFEYLKNTGLL